MNRGLKGMVKDFDQDLTAEEERPCDPNSGIWHLEFGIGSGGFALVIAVRSR
jgi:hypothetical protein